MKYHKISFDSIPYVYNIGPIVIKDFGGYNIPIVITGKSNDIVDLTKYMPDGFDYRPKSEKEEDEIFKLLSKFTKTFVFNQNLSFIININNGVPELLNVENVYTVDLTLLRNMYPEQLYYFNSDDFKKYKDILYFLNMSLYSIDNLRFCRVFPQECRKHVN